MFNSSCKDFQLVVSKIFFYNVQMLSNALDLCTYCRSCLLFSHLTSLSRRVVWFITYRKRNSVHFTAQNSLYLIFLIDRRGSTLSCRLNFAGDIASAYSKTPQVTENVTLFSNYIKLQRKNNIPIGFRKMWHHPSKAIGWRVVVGCFPSSTHRCRPPCSFNTT